MTDLTAIVDRWQLLRVLVVGDAMVDRYVRCHALPSGALAEDGGGDWPGGAANVAANVASLGGVATLLGAVRDDAEGLWLQRRFGTLTWAHDRPTTVKTRVLCGPRLACRHDRESCAPLGDNAEREVLWRLGRAEADAYVLSDYAKGVVTPKVARAVVAAARGRPVVVDSKGSHWGPFRGATVVKGTREEVARLAGGRYGTAPLREAFAGSSVLVTLGGRGMVLHPAGGGGLALAAPALPGDVIDPTGAGDTACAALALALAAGASLGDAARLANVAAGLSVRAGGTCAVGAARVRECLGVDYCGRE